VTVGELMAQAGVSADTEILVDQGWLSTVDRDETTPWIAVTHANVNVETPGGSSVVLS
jgi:hypothetical protein